jgi:hypothetical protein
VDKLLTSRQTPYLGEHLISWLLVLISMPFCALVLYKIRETNYEAEEVVTVDDAAIADKANEMTVKVAEESREN